MKIFKTVLTILIFTLIVSIPSTLFAKKAKESGALNKVIAIGHVDTGLMSFANMKPGQLGDLFRNKIKKRLEESGYVVVLPVVKTTEKEEEKIEDLPQPKTAAEAMKYASKMQEMMEKMAMRASGRYVHEPVAAQALFNFSVSRVEKGVDTGGLFSEAEYLTGAPVGSADFSSKSIKVSLECIQLDPKLGHVVDQHQAAASSTKLSRVGGASYYTMEDTSNPDQAFGRMFDRAVTKCVKWVDQKLAPLPWEGQVFNKSGSDFMINAGSKSGITVGMTFDAFDRKTVSSGAIELGTEDVATGTLEVTKVQEGYSAAKLVSGKVNKGDLVKLSIRD